MRIVLKFGTAVGFLILGVLTEAVERSDTFDSNLVMGREVFDPA
jgi:hypothetical protein